MTAVKIVGVAVAAALAAACIRPHKPEMALALVICAGTGICVMMLDELRACVNLFNAVSETAGTEGYIPLMKRACGVAVICQFAMELCRDSGESALAGRIELGARAVILAMAAPVVLSVFEMVSALTA